MPRPQRQRRICALPENQRFGPLPGPADGEVTLTLDEYETIRLMDGRGLTHEQCADVMRISRTTVTEIYASARRKLAEMVVNGRQLAIGGGHVSLCDHTSPCDCCACPESTVKER